MRISDWSSDVCSSDLADTGFAGRRIVVFKVRVDQHLTEHDALRREDLQQQRLRAVEILARKAGRAQTILIADHHEQIGRASCWERSVRVVLGGRSLIKQKPHIRKKTT